MSRNSRKGLRTAISVLVVCTTVGARSVSGDVLITPFVGVTFGGDTTEKQDTYGISIGGMAAGVFGVELDVARSGRVFGGETLFTDGGLTTAMGNLLVGAPLGRVRPYAVGGLGLIRTNASTTGTEVSRSELGVDVGAGLMGFFSDHVGARVDVRYFQNVTGGDDSALDFDLGDLSFWRASVGATFRF